MGLAALGGPFRRQQQRRLDGQMIALLTVDLQRDFLDPESPSGLGRIEKSFCLPAVRSLLNHARETGWTVVHIATEHQGPESQPLRMRLRQSKPFCIAGTAGAKLVEGLQQGTELVVKKRSFSGFLGTELAQHLTAADRIVICGVASDCCVLQTAFDASERYGKEVVVPYNATSAATADAHAFGLQAINKSVGAVLATSTLLSCPPADWHTHALSDDSIGPVAREWFQACR